MKLEVQSTDQKPLGSTRDPRPFVTQLQARTWNNFVETTGLLEIKGRYRTLVLVILNRSGMWYLMGQIFGGNGWKGLQRGFRRWLWATTHWLSNRVLSCGVQGVLCPPPLCLPCNMSPFANVMRHFNPVVSQMNILSMRMRHLPSRSSTDMGLLLHINAKDSLSDYKCEI